MLKEIYLEDGYKVTIEKEDTKKLPLHLRGNIINKSIDDDGQRIIAGYASVIEVDTRKDLVPQKVLEDGIQTLLSDYQYANIQLSHKNIPIGKIIPSYKDLSTHVDEHGLYIVAKIRNDLEIANIVWNAIENGEVNGFSIASEIILSHRECNENECYRVIDKLHIFEVSICTKPVNTKSGFIIVAKGECEECSFVDVSDNLNIEVKDMVKKEKKLQPKPEPETVEHSEPEPEVVENSENPQPEVVENSEAEPEISLKDSIEALSRELESIKGTLAELMKPDEEPPEEEDEEEEVEMSEPAPKPEVVENSEPEPTPEPIQNSEPQEDFINLYNKDIETIKKSITDLTTKISKLEKFGELEIALKAKDDEMNALIRRIEVIEGTEEQPQTTTEEVESNTEVSTEETATEEEYSDFVKDSIAPGVFYRDPDY